MKHPTRLEMLLDGTTSQGPISGPCSPWEGAVARGHPLPGGGGVQSPTLSFLAPGCRLFPTDAQPLDAPTHK